MNDCILHCIYMYIGYTWQGHVTLTDQCCHTQKYHFKTSIQNILYLSHLSYNWQNTNEKRKVQFKLRSKFLKTNTKTFELFKWLKKSMEAFWILIFIFIYLHHIFISFFLWNTVAVIKVFIFTMKLCF